MSGKRLSEKAFYLLLFWFWSRRFLCLYIKAVIMRIPILSYFSEQFIPFVSIVLLFFAFPYINKKIKGIDILAMLAFAFAYCLSILIYPDNSDYLISISGRIWFTVLPVYFLGLALDSEEYVDFLYKVSVLNMFFHGIYMLAFGHAMSEESSVITGSMGKAYALLAPVLLIGMYSMEHMDIKKLALFLVLSIYLISCGTRGAVLCLVLFVIAYVVIYKKPTENMGFFILFVAAMALLIIRFDALIKWLFIVAEKTGMSVRVMRHLQMGVIDFSGRDKILLKMFDAIQENPIFGYGVAGDQMIAKTYSHNIIVELLVSHGVIIGTGLILLGSSIIYKGYKKAISRKMKIFIMVLFFSSVTKLLLSDRYLFEPLFFLLLGVCVGQIRKRRAVFAYETV